MRKWRAFCQPITERSNAKAKQKRNYFRHSIEKCSIMNGYYYKKRLRDVDSFQVDTMDISAGVLVREGKIVRRGPRQVIHK